MEDAIFEEAQNHDLIIMGAPEEGLVRRALFGDIPVNIAQKIDAPLILTKRYDGNVKSWFQKFFGSRKTMLELEIQNKSWHQILYFYMYMLAYFLSLRLQRVKEMWRKWERADQ